METLTKYPTHWIGIDIIIGRIDTKISDLDAEISAR